MARTKSKKRSRARRAAVDVAVQEEDDDEESGVAAAVSAAPAAAPAAASHAAPDAEVAKERRKSKRGLEVASAAEDAAEDVADELLGDAGAAAKKKKSVRLERGVPTGKERKVLEAACLELRHRLCWLLLHAANWKEIVSVEAKGDCWLIAARLNGKGLAHATAAEAKSLGKASTAKRGKLLSTRHAIADAMCGVGHIFANDEELQAWGISRYVLGAARGTTRILAALGKMVLRWRSPFFWCFGGSAAPEGGECAIRDIMIMDASARSLKCVFSLSFLTVMSQEVVMWATGKVLHRNIVSIKPRYRPHDWSELHDQAAMEAYDVAELPIYRDHCMVFNEFGMPCSAAIDGLNMDWDLQHRCIHTYMHTHIYIHTYINTHMHTSIHPYIHAQLCFLIHTCIHTHTHTYIHMCRSVLTHIANLLKEGKERTAVILHESQHYNALQPSTNPRESALRPHP